MLAKKLKALFRADQANTTIESQKSEIDKTRKALVDVQQHEFRFGYQYAFEQNRITLSWNWDKSLSININSCKPEDDVWFGNCYDDAWVTREFLNKRVGKGAIITVQRIESESFVGRLANTEHYRVLVEQHDESGSGNSIFAEVDHSPFYRKTATGDRSSIDSWVETNYVQEGKRSNRIQDANAFFPMCEYEIDGREKILYFTFEIEESEQAIYIRMQQFDSTDEEQKLDALRYPIYFRQLGDPKKLVKDIINNPAFKPDGPFGDTMHPITLEKMKQGLALVVEKLPSFEY